MQVCMENRSSGRAAQVPKRASQHGGDSYKTVLGEIYVPPPDYTVGEISFNGTNRCYHSDESADTKTEINGQQPQMPYVNVFVTSGAALGVKGMDTMQIGALKLFCWVANAGLAY